MQVAYCDESADTRGTPFVFSVAGYLGHAREWVELERRWNRALRQESLPEFHMSWCENRLKHFQDMERDRRDYLQRKFIGIILECNLWGHASAIHMQPYNAVMPKMQEGRGIELAKPYFLAFQHTVEMMAITLDEAPNAGDERIAFVFDQHDEHEGMAKALYDSLSAPGNEVSYYHRLGSLTFDSRLRAIPLQAADVWVYENLRHVREVQIAKQQPRWQWNLLQSSKRNTGRMFTADEIDVLLKAIADSPSPVFSESLAPDEGQR